MKKDWFWYHADLYGATQCFRDRSDFIVWVYLLGWKSGLSPEDIKPRDG